MLNTWEAAPVSVDLQVRPRGFESMTPSADGKIFGENVFILTNVS
jgi:hypothetical protein